MELKRAKGTKDYLFEEELLRQDILNSLVNTFQLYGYNPIQTPILELYDVLAGKYSGGAEILKETFKLRDQGNRELALRYDLTVPLARFVAMNPQLKLPIKRYQIGGVFRDGPIKLGRYREFYQCDIDVVGIKGMEADIEILTIAQRAFKALKLDVIIKLNNRKILDAIMDKLEIPANKRESIILTIDKLDKIGINNVTQELQDKGMKNSIIQQLMEILLMESRNEDKLSFLRQLLGNNQGLDELQTVLESAGGVVDFDPSLARGLNYYTGTIFEVFIQDRSITSSLAAGGRYDKMISGFIGKPGYEAVGISFGLDVISDALRLKGKGSKQSVTQLYVIPIQTFQQARLIAEQLRNNNILCEIDLTGRGISKNLDYASKMGIPFVLFVGKQELEKEKLKLRNMVSGKEDLLTIEEVAQKVTKAFSS